jgi:O-antigen ligase
MKEHLVALCYVLLIAGVCFALMFKPMTARLMSVQDFQRRFGLWFAVTLITFLAHSFWLALVLCAVVTAVVSARERNPAALYCALLFAAPLYQMGIPGLGLVNQLFEVNHARMLALVVLLPAALRLSQLPRAFNPRLAWADVLVASYFLYAFVVHATADSITGLMRHLTYITLDHVLLYYVITRSIVSRRSCLELMACLVAALTVAGMTGAFENVRHWLVYESLRAPLGVPFDTIGTYLLRATEDGAYLRAYTTMGHAIAFGFALTVALTWQLALFERYAPKPLGAAIVAILVIGLLASVSRGPWLACAVAVLVGLSFGPGAGKRLLWMLALLPLVLAALIILPQGQKFIDLLPFIGTVEAANVTYRTQLIDRALIVFWQNPIFGSLQFIENPVLEEMRQGQGIIDIVNSYVGVALAYGSIGLALFVAPALFALTAALVTRHRLSAKDLASEVVGRALSVSLLASLLLIGTASLIFHIPILHWMLVALCVTYAAWAPGWRSAGPAAVASERSVAPSLAAGRPVWRI